MIGLGKRRAVAPRSHGLRIPTGGGGHAGNALLQENGDFLLQESGDLILLEQ